MRFRVEGAQAPEPGGEAAALGQVLRRLAEGVRPFHDGPPQGLADRPDAVAVVSLHGQGKSSATAAAD
ncbi:hypothetical protein MKK63_11285 [Methylobacterium sp. J-088]|uniref:hypothetical protein n=1 Tax=Methylobacterium sp. J-088 TaxID=2836664 RepID=UPI001FBA0837|nr:hypothetical protein [Methylobacterium sp. J-088]MCJ2063292.1 hypothetical protein [Methylobacterium sp. J-088]